MTEQDEAAKRIPEGYRLSKMVNKDIVLSEEYQHWTVADVREMLAKYPQDARVWLLTGASTIAPLEFISAGDGAVFL